MTPIMAAGQWRTNAALIAEAVVPMGYLRPEDVVLDPTYGKGAWWRNWQPTSGRIVIPPKGSDFRCLGYRDDSLDAAAYDPPYTCVGGRETSNVKTMYEAYGILDAPESPEAVQALINDGLAEMHRLVRPSARKRLHPTKPNGIVLVKCKSYIWNNELWLGVHKTIEHALSLGFEVETMFQHVGGSGPQPARTVKGEPSSQAHPRNNYSTLVVLRKFKEAA